MKYLSFTHMRRVWRLLRNPQAGWTPKILAILAVWYLIWPIDIVPDVIPLSGWIDDMIIGSLIFSYLSEITSRYEEKK